MIFIAGPRQVGKTTLGKRLLNKEVLPQSNYFNWEVTQDRKKSTTQVFQGKIQLEPQRICFDEIHKYKHWKTALKGLFDSNEPNTHWIITGSALLDTFKKGQDSLLGRQFTYTLCPLTVRELTDKACSILTNKDLINTKFLPQPAENIHVLNDL